jgi:predicted transglutaminase-like cysteine proteinase
MRRLHKTIVLAVSAVAAALIGTLPWCPFGDLSAVVWAREISVAVIATGTSNHENSDPADKRLSVAQNAHSADVRLEPFNTKSVSAGTEVALWKKWDAVAHAFRNELDAVSACAETANKNTCSSGAALKFRNIVAASLKKEGRARLDLVNRAVNIAVQSTSDSRQHGLPDHWATPYGTLESAKGDCEDYATTKYALLRAMKWPKNDLRLVIVYIASLGENHVVLAARLGQNWFILDNLTIVLKEDDHLRQTYHPLFMIDETELRMLYRPKPAEMSKIAKWKEIGFRTSEPP